MWEDGLEISLMLSSELESFDKLLDRLEPSKDGIMSTKRILPKKDLKCSLFLMFILNKIRVGACELIEIIVEEINLSESLV